MKAVKYMAWIGIFVLISCKEFCIEGINKPSNVFPIDWENYNDVYTVFWNYYTFCTETNENDRNKEIMISGWIYICSNSCRSEISLVEKNRVNDDFPFHIVHVLSSDDDMYKEFRAVLDTCDLSKECFIKGKLIFSCDETAPTRQCAKSKPFIVLNSIDDIYFK